MSLRRSIVRATCLRHETGWTFSLLVLALFAAAQVMVHVHHEPWRDELHCWTVGRNARGLWDLLTGERQYDGHPFLWYYLLHLVSRVWSSYLALHAVTIILATTSAALWLRWAPLPRFLRVPLLGSYYFFYEYGVLCRSYALGLTLVFTVCALYHPLRIRYVWTGILLALCAATSLYGTILAVSVGWFVFSHGPVLQREAEGVPRWRVTVRSSWLIGVVILVVGLVVTTVTTLPPADSGIAPGPMPELTGKLLRGAAAGFWAAMFPFGGLHRWEWTGSDYLGSTTPWVAALAPWLGLTWFALWLIAFARRPRVAATFGVGILAINFAQVAIYGGGWRHTGHNFVLTVVCLWLYARESRGRSPDRFLHGLFALNLLLQLVTAFVAVRTDWRETFSGAAAAARFIRDHHLEDRPVVANADHPTSAVAAILQRRFYFVVTGETTDSVVFHNRRWGPSSDDIVTHATRLARAGDGTALMVLNHVLDAHPHPGVAWHLIYQGGPALVADESFSIYELDVQR